MAQVEGMSENRLQLWIPDDFTSFFLDEILIVHSHPNLSLSITISYLATREKRT